MFVNLYKAANTHTEEPIYIVLSTYVYSLVVRMYRPPTAVGKPPIVAVAVVEGQWVWLLRQLQWAEQQLLPW